MQRLYVGNTGRFHFVNQIAGTIMGFAPLYLCGFSLRAIHVYTGFLTVVGLLSHSNIDTDCSVLNFIFNT